MAPKPPKKRKGSPGGGSGGWDEPPEAVDTSVNDAFFAAISKAWDSILAAFPYVACSMLRFTRTQEEHRPNARHRKITRCQ